MDAVVAAAAITGAIEEDVFDVLNEAKVSGCVGFKVAGFYFVFCRAWVALCCLQRKVMVANVAHVDAATTADNFKVVRSAAGLKITADKSLYLLREFNKRAAV